jgi:hypothetical protein
MIEALVKSYQPASKFSFTSNGGIWLTIPGMFVILHQADKERSCQQLEKTEAI